MKRTADDADSSPAKRPKAAVTLTEGKLFQLWGSTFTKQERAAMQLDETAVFSVTDARTADRMTTYMLALSGGPFERVADGCACVGGNSLSFGRALARTGGRVLAIELDQTRHAMLQHNVRVANLGETVACVRADFSRLVFEGPDDDLRRCQVLFLDPPWGGPQVGSMPMDSVELEMGGRSLHDLVHRIARPDFAVQHVLFKLPPNYKFDKLVADLSDVATVSVERAYRKMVLLVASFREQKSAPDQLPEREVMDNAA